MSRCLAGVLQTGKEALSVFLGLFDRGPGPDSHARFPAEHILRSEHERNAWACRPKPNQVGAVEKMEAELLCHLVEIHRPH